MRFIKIAFITATTFLALSRVAFAAVSITEIMYAPSGADDDHEWIEIYNDGTVTDVSAWKFFEGGVNHGLTLHQGNATLPSGGYAIIADNAVKFLQDFPSYSGALFDSSFSLLNSSETLSLKDDQSNVADSVTYDAAWGAKDDGNSLQKTGGSFSAAAPTPGSGIAGSGGETPSSEGTAASTSPSSSGSSSSNWPVEPQIFANAGPDRIAVAGADIVFEGKASGLQKEPIENARFVWNFGDGVRAEGKKVSHAYRFPGDYIVVLDVASGYYSASDRARVQVEASAVTIARVGDGFIELMNGSNHELDLSGWTLRSSGTLFVLPDHTVIAGNKKLVLANDVTALVPSESPELLYPNGSLAHRYEKGKASSVSNSTSVALVTEKSAAKATPHNEGTQAAVVALALDEGADGVSGAMPQSYKWLLGVIAIAMVGVVGVAFGAFPNKKPGELTAEDFTIIEEK